MRESRDMNRRERKRKVDKNGKGRMWTELSKEIERRERNNFLERKKEGKVIQNEEKEGI